MSFPSLLQNCLEQRFSNYRRHLPVGRKRNLRGSRKIIKSLKFRNKLQVLNTLRLKLSQIKINVKCTIENSKKQAHPFQFSLALRKI